MSFALFLLELAILVLTGVSGGPRCWLRNRCSFNVLRKGWGKEGYCGG